MAFEGIAQGINILAKGAQGYQAGSTREARQAYQRKIAEDNLATQRANAAAQPDQVQAEMDALKAQNQQITSALAKQKTYEAWRAYNEDGELKHLERAFKDPLLHDLFANFVSVDKINPDTDTQLLLKNNMDPGMFTDENIDKDAFLHRFVRVTLPDGTRKISDLLTAQGATGYTDYASRQELDIALKRAQIYKAQQGEQYAPSALEKDAKFISETTGRNVTDVTEKLFTAKTAGVTPGKLEVATEAEVALNETFGNKYFSTDFSKRENQLQASQYIRKIEQAGGQELAAADRADLKDISMLIASGTTVAEELTPEQTGILDNFTNNVKKYLDDTGASGTAGRSAYNAYRNALLRAFGGTAMSDSEVKNFDAAFGTLNQKYPAVLTQFQEAIRQTKAKLGTIARLNNPYVAHYYLGASQDDVDIIMTRLDTTLERLNGVKSKSKSDWRNDWVD